jgi:hypothetical protein
MPRVVVVAFEPALEERKLIPAPGGDTVIEIVATFEVAAPSDAEKVKESGPVVPGFGVYVTAAESVLGAPGEHGASEMVPRDPLEGGVSIENVSSHESGSLAVNETWTGVSWIVEADPSFAVGGSFVPDTVIETVAGVDACVPSWTRNVKESEPSKLGAGV